MQRPNMRIGLSLLDKTWNDAIEAAAKNCEQVAHAFRSAGGDADSYTWEWAKRMDEQAANIRELKRVGHSG